MIAGRQNLIVKPTAEFGARARSLNYHPGGALIYSTTRPVQGLMAKGGKFFIYIDHYGAGRIIHWNDPDGLTNIHLRKFPDNAVLFILLMQEYAIPPRIVFCNDLLLPDNHSAYSGMHREKYWLGAFLLLAGAGLLLGKLTVRFGRPRPLSLAKGHSADEFVYSMAALFQQADLKEIVLDNLYQSLRQKIIKITGLTSESDWAALNDHLIALTGKEFAQKVILAMELYQKYFDIKYQDIKYQDIKYQDIKYQRQKISRTKFLELANQLDLYRKELSEWKI